MERTTETYTGQPAHFKNEEAYLEWLANNQMETLLSECCRAGIRYELRESSTCSETGWRDEGGRFEVCAECGADFEPMGVNAGPEFPARKPVSRQQGELFNQEVA